MRRRKHKHTRRAIVFYRLNFGFHEPFKASLGLSGMNCKAVSMAWAACITHHWVACT